VFFDTLNQAKLYLPHMHSLSIESKIERARSAAKKYTRSPFFFTHVFIVARRINVVAAARNLRQTNVSRPTECISLRWDDPICVVAFRRASTQTWSCLVNLFFGFSASFVSRSWSTARGKNSTKRKTRPYDGYREIARNRALRCVCV